MSIDHDGPPIRPLWWADGRLCYVDQRRLPDTIGVAYATSVRDAIEALNSASIEGRRCVDVFAAFAVVLAQLHAAPGERAAAVTALRLAAAEAAATDRLEALESVVRAPENTALRVAAFALSETLRIDRAVAGCAATLLPEHANILTLGATGAFATGGFGTACGAIVQAHRAGNRLHAFVAETRPRETGARLTACELRAARVPCTVFPDGGVATVMHQSPIAAVVAGAHAIAANGDVIAELGTLQVAIAAAHFRIPLYITVPRNAVEIVPSSAVETAPSNPVETAPSNPVETAPSNPVETAPSKPVETATSNPVETAPSKRVETATSNAAGTLLHNAVDTMARDTVDPRAQDVVRSPHTSAATLSSARFDLTPGHLITAIVTEYGVCRPPYDESLAVLASRPRFALIRPAAAPGETPAASP